MKVHGSPRACGVGVMRRFASFALLTILASAIAAPAAAQGFGFGAPQGQEKVDTAAIMKIKAEGFQHSQVMDLLSWLTDVYAPRVTGAPYARVAGDWVVDQFKQWGLANPHYETWGPFGRGWENDRMMAQVTAPVAYPVIAYPGAWTDGTNGTVSTDVVMVPSNIMTAKQFEPYRGKLKGKIVVSQPPPAIPALWNAPAHRYTKEELDALSNPFPVRGGGRGAFAGRGRGGRVAAESPDGSPLVILSQCFIDEGAAAVLLPGRGNGGTVFPGGQGSRAADAPKGIPQVSVASEHYGRIWRTLEKGVPVKMDLNVKNTFYTNDLNSFNIIAEIPGTDLADEVVLIGGHFDTWHSGTGATDNGAGTAIDDGGDAHPEDAQHADAPYRPHRPLDGRGAGADRLTRVRHRALRRPRDHGAQARTREVRRLLQRRQRRRRDPWDLPAGRCRCRPDLLAVDAAAEQRQHPHWAGSRPATRPGPTTSPSTRWGCPGSSSSRTRSST